MATPLAAVWNCPVVDLSLVRPFTTNDTASRIVGGQEATPGQFPYQVGVWIKQSLTTRAFCGGSILNPHVIMTAGHCVVGALNVVIIAGAHQITHPEPHHQVRRVGKMLIHEAFELSSLDNDIALLHLPKALEFNARVSAVALPSADQASSLFTSAKVVVSGWGQSTAYIHHITPELHFVESHVISNTMCKVRFFLQATIKTAHICVSGRWARGPCQGDSGGPMVTTGSDNKTILLGVTSFGTRAGCSLSWPSVFTRVTSYLDWITEGTNQLMHDSG